MIAEILGHTELLLAGLLVNFMISIVAMTAGTLLGLLVASARISARTGMIVLGNLLNNLCRNIPSFVLMFYMAFLIPIEIILPWQLSLTAPYLIEQISIISVSPWIKGSLALTIPVIGFSGDLFYNHHQNKKWRNMRKEKDDFSHLLESWVNYLLIIIMASATASVIGVQEIVGVANNIIAARPDANYFRLGLYLYVAGWFLTLGIMVNFMVSLLHKKLEKPGLKGLEEQPTVTVREAGKRAD